MGCLLVYSHSIHTLFVPLIHTGFIFVHYPLLSVFPLNLLMDINVICSASGFVIYCLFFLAPFGWFQIFISVMMSAWGWTQMLRGKGRLTINKVFISPKTLDKHKGILTQRTRIWPRLTREGPVKYTQALNKTQVQVNTHTQEEHGGNTGARMWPGHIPSIFHFKDHRCN